MRIPSRIMSLVFIIILAPMYINASETSALNYNRSWKPWSSPVAMPDYRAVTIKGSDVIASIRFNPKQAPETAQKAPKFIQDFNPTRIEWTYISDKDFINSTILSKNIIFGGSINANTPTKNDAGIARDFDGNPLIAPWMKGWGTKWITSAHSESRLALFNQASRAIANGATTIQFDDPLLQAHTFYWGGDFSESSLIGFDKYLREQNTVDIQREFELSEAFIDYRNYLKAKYGVNNTDDYKNRYKQFKSTPIWQNYLQTTVIKDLLEIKNGLKTKFAKPVSLSMNLGSIIRPDEKNIQFFLTQIADRAMAETPIEDYASLLIRASTFRSLGIEYTPSIFPTTPEETRGAIATYFALGTPPLVPWDVYAQTNNRSNDKPQRYFGNAADYADLFTFVRQYPQLFDNWENIYMAGIPVTIDMYRDEPTKRIVKELIAAHIPFGFVPMGGTRWKPETSSGRLNSFMLLAMPNYMKDFSDTDKSLISNTSTPQIGLKELSALSTLKPFEILPDNQSIRIIPKTKHNQANEMLVHIVQDNFSAKPAPGNCTYKIRFNKIILASRTTATIEWYSPGKPVKNLRWQNKNGAIELDLQECPSWGIARLIFKP